MLVNTHKLALSLILFLGWNTVQAQEVWTLKQCIGVANVYNKTLQINKNSIEISNQRELEAKSNLIPRLTLNADYKYFVELPTQLMPLNALNPQVPEGQFRELQFGVPHNIGANLQLTLPIYNPQIYGGIRTSQAAGEMMELNYQKSVEQVEYDITNLYYNAQIVQHQLKFIDSNLININKLLSSMQLLQEQLLVKGTDVNKIKLQKDQLETQRDLVSNKYSQLLNALKLNMGIELGKEIVIDPTIQFQISSEAKNNNNIEVRIIKSQNSLLNSELKTLNQSRYLPSFNFVASYGLNGYGYDKKPHEFLKFYQVGFVGVQFSYPLFSGTVLQRKINQKKLEIKNNELQERLVTDKNNMEISNISNQLTVTKKVIVNTENQIEQARKIYEQTVLQQKQGTATITDVLLADNALREAQQNYLSAIIDYLKADLEFKKLTGNISMKNEE